MTDDRTVREQVAKVEQLLTALEAVVDSACRATAVETVQTLLALYGEGLARIVALAARTNDGALLDAFAADELIAHLLLLHDLHPTDVETRVQQALAEVQPYMASHGGSVELLRIENGVAHLRLLGSCHGCPSSATTLQSTVEQAIQKLAPDLLGIEAEGAVTPPARAANFAPVGVLIQLEGIAADD